MFNFKNLLYLFFPKRCPFCKDVINKDEITCENCKNSIKNEVNIRKIAIEGLQTEIICVSPFSYKDKIKSAICDYKFRGKLDYCNIFSQEMANLVQKYFKNIDIITSVPLHKSRQKERGFNQSANLAQKIGETIKIKYLDLLIKTKNNKIQHNLSKKDRIENVKNAYDIMDKNLIKNKNILLCDDIITTGNTLKECAKILLENGAKNVYCATIASSNLSI